MTVRKRLEGYQVEVNYTKALPGFRRIRKQCNGSMSDAKRLEHDIRLSLQTYGKWPVGPEDHPLVINEETKRHGTLREATSLALETHWRGRPYGNTVATVIWVMVDYFERERNVYDLDDIDSDDLDAYVQWCRLRGNKSETINKNLSMLSVVSRVARKRKPPLSMEVLPIDRLKAEPLEKWWMRPEQMEKLLAWLRGPAADPLMADYVELLVREGLRVKEALALEPRHFTGLDGDRPSLLVPGTKTSGSQATIPVFDDALDVSIRSVRRAEMNGWRTLFPMTWRQAWRRWQECRVYLGVEDIETSTLKSLRRTFAHFATIRGMPTSTMQKVLRHEDIKTTVGYTDLVGSHEVEESRKYMAADRASNPIRDAIAAYKATGASPQEVAIYTKELLR